MSDFQLLLSQELDRQMTTLLTKGYPEAASLSKHDFLAHLLPLKEKLQTLNSFEIDLEKGVLPFVLVVKSELVATQKAITMTDRDGKESMIKLSPLSPTDFRTTADITLPAPPIYLLVGVDRGKETINVRPCDALPLIIAQNRSPLTIDEGVAIITHFPAFLMKNNCFSLLASRHADDQRVPALWINSHKQANLGWCWDGNPHTWIGSASCAFRT